MEAKTEQLEKNPVVKAVTEPQPEEKPAAKLAVNPVVKANIEPMHATASAEEKILWFLRTRGNGQYVKVNDFLKSLYPVQRGNIPPVWKQQGVLKSLQGIIRKMANSGDIVVANNRYLQLGKCYWPNGVAETHYYDLDAITIEAKLP